MNTMTKPGRLVATLIATLFLAIGAPHCTAGDETLNNESIIEMQGLNLGDSVIIEKIRTTKGDYDTSIKALKKLKDAKVSDAVIQAMMATKDSGSAPVYRAPRAATEGSNDPAAAHAAGVWIMKDKKMIRLESETPAEMSTGGGAWAWGWGGSSKTQVILNGTKSDTQLTDRKPVFYVYVGRNNYMMGQDIGAAEFVAVESPHDIVLAQFTVKVKNDHNERLLVTGSHNAYAGSTIGIEAKAMRQFDSEQIADGIFKVTPQKDLEDGEYAFSSAMNKGHGRFFTFGVQGK